MTLEMKSGNGFLPWDVQGDETLLGHGFIVDFKNLLSHEMVCHRRALKPVMCGASGAGSQLLDLELCRAPLRTCGARVSVNCRVIGGKTLQRCCHGELGLSLSTVFMSCLGCTPPVDAFCPAGPQVAGGLAWRQVGRTPGEHRGRG